MIDELLKKWKPMLEYTSETYPPIPEKDWEVVARTMEKWERKVPEGGIKIKIIIISIRKYLEEPEIVKIDEKDYYKMKDYNETTGKTQVIAIPVEGDLEEVIISGTELKYRGYVMEDGKWKEDYI